MKEIEILVKVYTPIEEVKKIFKKFTYLGLSHVVDEYYYDPKRDNLKPDSHGEINECLRLRSSDDKHYITYKDDVYDKDIWLYSNEYETEISNVDTIKEIFKRLGLKKLLEIDNQKEKYQYQDYEIVLENVKELGAFMEVEYCTDEDVSVDDIKSSIREFIKELNISVSEELNEGKPEMMIKLKNIKV